MLGLVNHVIVGARTEPITQLTSADWLGPYAGDFGELGRTELALFGAWNIEAQARGQYQVSLYLFPPDARTALNQPLRNIPARPITGARLLIDGEARTLQTKPSATHASFTLALQAGERHRIEGQFLDATGKPIVGAFFLRVTKL